jgi:predicted NAD/FAD-binding protein
MSWETTVDAWIRSLPLTRDFKENVLHPWITATIGCARSDARRTSARSILQTFALAFPADLLEGPTTYTSKIGLQGNLQRMLDRSPGVRVHLRTPVRALSRNRGRWFLETRTGRKGPYRFVVLNAPPRAGRELLRPLPAFADVTELLDVYRYFDSRLLVHTDPAYVHRDRTNWSAYNAGLNGSNCEGSAWLGALQGSSVHVFKSWAQRRRADPEQIVLERRFKHPLITRSTIEAARALGPLQGRRGLYFSGHYTTGMDLQESAVYSAMQVAKALAPGSRTLASLETRLSARGLAGISYDL